MDDNRCERDATRLDSQDLKSDFSKLGRPSLLSTIMASSSSATRLKLLTLLNVSQAVPSSRKGDTAPPPASTTGPDSESGTIKKPKRRIVFREDLISGPSGSGSPTSSSSSGGDGGRKKKARAEDETAPCKTKAKAAAALPEAQADSDVDDDESSPGKLSCSSLASACPF